MFDRKAINRPRFWWIIFSMLTGLNLSVEANGIFRNGTGAESMAMGGTDTAWANNPLGAMGDNPAGLGFLYQSEFDLGGVGVIPEGSFNKPPVSSGSMDDSFSGFPETALALRLGKSPVTAGLSFIPDSALVADWHYNDPPGGLNGTTSYGYQEDKSEIIVLRSALGAGIDINSELSFGASLGLIYNENQLKAPYIFQNLSPAADEKYDGAKTLLNLHTDGFGWNAQAGLIYRATTNLQFGVSYRSPTSVHSTGDANGDPSTQFGYPQGTLPFHYDAAVETHFPQEISGGMSWQFHPQWRLALQVDWINWSDAFDSLPVNLKNGNNPNVNAVLGSGFSDLMPLNWKDEFVYRAGVEYNVTKNLSLRAGYSYGDSPVPDSTLTPMTAVIMEHTLTAGLGYRWGRYEVDVAYQYDLPVNRYVVDSSLLSGEYSDSSTSVSLHTLAITARIRF
jgi:long-chain fatty acid transport protein